MIKNAVIAGHDGNIWASSSGFNVSASFLPSANASDVKICKILGREQSIAWKGFNFWRAYEPSWAPVTAFVMGEMWNRIRARCSREAAEARVGEAGSQLRNLRLSWFLLLRDASRNLLFSFRQFFSSSKIKTKIDLKDWQVIGCIFVCRSVFFLLSQFSSLSIS